MFFPCLGIICVIVYGSALQIPTGVCVDRMGRHSSVQGLYFIRANERSCECVCGSR